MQALDRQRRRIIHTREVQVHAVFRRNPPLGQSNNGHEHIY